MIKIQVILVVMLFSLASTGQAQFLKKLKEKAAAAAGKVLDKKQEKKDTTQASSEISELGEEPAPTAGNERAKVKNQGGEGLKNTSLPNVHQMFREVDSSYKVGSFSDARYALQQALKGIEMEMGKQLLRSLPGTVTGLTVDSSQDVVSCSSWGWSNMVIKRQYYKNDQQLDIIMGNANEKYPLYKSYFDGNMQSNNEELNWKEIKIKGRRAIIEYEKSEGYTVSVAVGQTSLITWKGINFANEQAIMQAVNTFDVNAIVKLMGEN